MALPGGKVKARELEPGMVISAVGGQVGGAGLQLSVERTVTAVGRSADKVEELRGLIAKTRGRAILKAYASAMVWALAALEYEGRESVFVELAEQSEPVTFAASDEVRYVGRASSFSLGVG